MPNDCDDLREHVREVATAKGVPLLPCCPICHARVELGLAELHTIRCGGRTYRVCCPMTSPLYRAGIPFESLMPPLAKALTRGSALSVAG
jgi:hypothetical protein